MPQRRRLWPCPVLRDPLDQRSKEKVSREEERETVRGGGRMAEAVDERERQRTKGATADT